MNGDFHSSVSMFTKRQKLSRADGEVVCVSNTIGRNVLKLTELSRFPSVHNSTILAISRLIVSVCHNKEMVAMDCKIFDVRDAE